MVTLSLQLPMETLQLWPQLRMPLLTQMLPQILMMKKTAMQKQLLQQL